MGGVGGALVSFAAITAIAAGAAVIYAPVWLRGGQRGGGTAACIRWMARLTALAAVCLIVIFSKLAYDPPPEMAFRRYVMEPVPASVRAIQSAGSHFGLDRASMLRFRIDPGDLEWVKAEHSLRRRDSPIPVRDVDLRVIAGPGRPDWWTLEDMVAPKAFEKHHMQGMHDLLVYGPVTRTALFMAYTT